MCVLLKTACDLLDILVNWYGVLKVAVGDNDSCQTNILLMQKLFLKWLKSCVQESEGTAVLALLFLFLI